MNVTSPSSSAFSKRRSGFTLVELLVVITIILLLTTVVFIATRAVRTSAAKAADMNNLKSLANATIAASDDSTGVLPPLHDTQRTLPHWLTDRETLESYGIYKEQCYSPGKGLPGGPTAYDWWFNKNSTPITESDDHMKTSLDNVKAVKRKVGSAGGSDSAPVQVHYVYFGNDGADLQSGWYKSGTVVAPKRSEFRGSQTVLEDIKSNQSGSSNKVFPRTATDDCWYPILWSSLCYKRGNKTFCALLKNDKPLGVNVFYLDGHVEWVPADKLAVRYRSGGGSYMW